MGELHFELPDEIDQRVRLLQAIPDDWKGVEGRLWADDNLKALKLVAENTKLQIDRWLNVKITGMRKQTQSVGPDLEACLVHQRLPELIHFDGIWEPGSEKFGVLKKLFIGYIKNKYTGFLHFFSDFQRNEVYRNKARCDFAFHSWEGAPILREESGHQPARVKIEWFPNYGGNEETVEPIIAACREQKLCEYKPYGSNPMG